MTSGSTWGLVVATGLMLVAGCGSCGATPSSSDSGADASAQGAEPSGPAHPLGVVEGTIRLAEGAELPRYTPEQLGRRPGQPALPDDCLPALETDLEPVRRTTDGLLDGVMVAVTGDVESFRRDLPPYTAQVRNVTIDRCRLAPRLLVAVRGDTLRVTNHMSYPFLPTLGETPFLRALTQGQFQDFELDRGGVRSLGCAFAAPCGRTEIVVVYHPVYAVTDAQGHFRIENVPVGDAVVFHAWHPLFEEASVTADVRAGQPTHVELVLSPLPPRPVAPAPVPNAAGVDLPIGDPAAMTESAGPTMAPGTMAP